MPSAAKRLVDPAFCQHPDRENWLYTLGPEVADLNARAGFAPDPEQEMLLDILFAVRSLEDDQERSSCYDFTVICGRQNLKTGLFKQAAIGFLYVTEQRLVVWSAHEMSTTKESMRDLVELIEGATALNKRLATGPSHGIFWGAADLHIELRTRQRVNFKARTTSGGRGLSGDKVFLDEGFALKASHMGSLLPTLSARPDPQVIIGSSAGHVDSAVLRGYRDRGRRGLSPRQAYVEWCSKELSCAQDDCTHEWGLSKGCAADDWDKIRATNPAIGRRITEETLQSERENLDPSEFLRERLGWWDDPTSTGPFPPGIWQARADAVLDPATGLAASQIEGVPSVAIAVSKDRRACAIGVAGPRADGRLQIEVVEDDRDGKALPIRVADLAKRAAGIAKKHGAAGVWLEPSSPAGSMGPALKKAGVEVLEVKGASVSQACGFLFDGILDGSIVHLGQEHLDTAVGKAAQRNAGGSWRWDDDTDVPPLMAVTLALWAFTSEIPAPPAPEALLAGAASGYTDTADLPNIGF